jgi:hypothetical protein
MPRPLIIGKEEKAAIKNLMFYAENNKINLKRMRMIMDRLLAPPGDNPNFLITLPVGFRVVFTIEQHPGGWHKHLSVSVPGKGHWPSIEAVDMIAQEFGIENFKDHYIYPEEDVEAVNVVVKIEGKEVESEDYV